MANSDPGVLEEPTKLLAVVFLTWLFKRYSEKWLLTVGLIFGIGFMFFELLVQNFVTLSIIFHPMTTFSYTLARLGPKLARARMILAFSLNFIAHGLVDSVTENVEVWIPRFWMEPMFGLIFVSCTPLAIIALMRKYFH